MQGKGPEAHCWAEITPGHGVCQPLQKEITSLFSLATGFARKTFISYSVTFGDSFRQGEVVGIDPERQQVLLGDGEVGDAITWTLSRIRAGNAVQLLQTSYSAGRGKTIVFNHPAEELGSRDCLPLHASLLAKRPGLEVC